MPFWAHPAVPLAAGAIGSLFKTGFDAHQVSKMNRFNAAEAQKGRDFNERMSNTAWQRGINDMRKAGINPALALQSGPASAPGGPSASGGASTATDPVASAMALKTAKEQLENLRSDRNLKDATAVKTRAEAEALGYSNRMTSAEMGRYFKRDNTGRYQMTPQLLEWLSREHEGRMAASSTQVQRLRNLRLEEAELRAISGIFDQVGSGGKAAQMILPILLSALRR